MQSDDFEDPLPIRPVQAAGGLRPPGEPAGVQLPQGLDGGVEDAARGPVQSAAYREQFHELRRRRVEAPVPVQAAQRRTTAVEAEDPVQAAQLRLPPGAQSGGAGRVLAVEHDARAGAQGGAPPAVDRPAGPHPGRPGRCRPKGRPRRDHGTERLSPVQAARARRRGPRVEHARLPGSSIHRPLPKRGTWATSASYLPAPEQRRAERERHDDPGREHQHHGRPIE